MERLQAAALQGGLRPQARPRRRALWPARARAARRLPRQGPGGSPPAPVIVMVHGGGWCVGDKAMAGVTANKVVRWTPKGLMLVSVNYPMVGDGYGAVGQAQAIAQAPGLCAEAGGGLGRRPQPRDPDGPLGRCAPGLARQCRA